MGNIAYGRIQEPFWDDRDVFIIGGGTSLKGFDFTRLHGKWVLGVNDAFLHLECNALFSLDTNWLRNRYKDYLSFSGEKYFAVPPNWVARQFIDPEATYLHRVRLDGLSMDSTEISGTNSGFGAFNLAVAKRAKRIILLGFDFYSGEDSTHWHPGYRWGSTGRILYEAWSKSFPIARDQVDTLGIMVLNTSLQSKIECFQKVDINELI